MADTAATKAALFLKSDIGESLNFGLFRRLFFFGNGNFLVVFFRFFVHHSFHVVHHSFGVIHHRRNSLFVKLVN